jgi:hypothetical protein
MKYVLWICLTVFSGLLHAQVKILFDCTKAETAGNADWTIDANQYNMNWNPGGCTGCGGDEANPQRFPVPAQSGIVSGTPETYWKGSLSSWGVDCAKYDYQVETLPFTGQITFGDASNPQDLTNYTAYIVDEPNILFTAAEKTALIEYVWHGGSLFMVSDHTQSDRNGDGFDSPAIWNDFISNNGVHNNKTGFSFDLENISQTSMNIPALPADSILNGGAGHVTEVQWSNGTTMTLNKTQNPTVKGVVFKTGASTSGNTGVMCAYSHVGCGKVAAIGDSSPTDDGTGDPNDQLYNGYWQDANGNHRKLLMNITFWLAAGPCQPVSATSDQAWELDVSVYPNPAREEVNIRYAVMERRPVVQVYDVFGRVRSVSMRFEGDGVNEVCVVEARGLEGGVYFVVVEGEGVKATRKVVVR